MVILSLCILSCVEQVSHTEHELGNIIEFFPHLDIYNIDKHESSKEPLVTYKINNEEVAKIDWESKKIFDSVKVFIPKEFDLFSNDTNRVVYEYKNKVIKFINSTYETNNTLDLLDGAYRFAVRNNYDFNLVSAKHFYDKSPDIDYLIMTLNLDLIDHKKYTISMFYKMGSERFFEFVYESDEALKMKDYLIVTEAISNIRFNDHKLIPLMNKIDNAVRVEL